MSFKKSSSITEKNKHAWRKNLVQFRGPSKRVNVEVHQTLLSERSRMPLKKHVIGRFKLFESSTKDRKKRIQLIAGELKVLWNQTLNFPQLSDQVIRAKLP